VVLCVNVDISEVWVHMPLSCQSPGYFRSTDWNMKGKRKQNKGPLPNQPTNKPKQTKNLNSPLKKVLT